MNGFRLSLRFIVENFRKRRIDSEFVFESTYLHILRNPVTSSG